MGANFTRREFVETSAGLVISFYLPPRRRVGGPNPPDAGFAPNAWLRIGADDSVTLTVDKSEMGQGSQTGLAMILAEELEADWANVRLGPVPENPAGWSRRMATGGSTAIRTSWDPLRKAGATAREMLISAAAATWNVDRTTCHAEQGAVIHTPTKRQLSYGKLAARAAQLPVPTDAPLKDPKDFRLLGTRAPRLDTPVKVDGSAVFGIDVTVPEMLIASIERCPVFGGMLKRYDGAKAQALPGVRAVVPLEPSPWTGRGGGFGRRLEPDFVAEAVRVSQAVGAPVKVIWSREDDVQHGFYRPATYNKFTAGLDAAGAPVAWSHRIVAPPILLKFGPLDKGIDRTLIDGAANLPYGIPNVLVDQVAVDLLPVPRGFWRSVGISQNAFVTECFFDEVAAAAKQDPFELRRQLLHDKPRHLRTLELAAEKAGWSSPLAARRGRGIAIAEWAPTVCAQVAEV